MRFEDVFKHTFRALLPQIEAAAKRRTDFTLPSLPMVDACRAEEFDFFQPWMDCGRLTAEQMRHAAGRYRLGKSRSGQTIFWMIDDMMQPLDGRMGDHWVSQLLKRREPILQDCWCVTHCLFGLHLLALEDLDSQQTSVLRQQPSALRHQPSALRQQPSALRHQPSALKHQPSSLSHHPSPIAIVESPQAAVVLSELYPNQLWLSTMPDTCFTIDQLEPLVGRHVKVYPHTDPTLSNYLAWLEIRDMAARTFHLDISVSSALEKAATAEQKERSIDVLDYIYETENIKHQTSDIKHD